MATTLDPTPPPGPPIGGPSNHGLLDIWRSERGLICVAALILAGVLFWTGRLSEAGWVDITKWLVGFYVVGKSATSAVETVIRNRFDTAVLKAGSDASSPEEPR